MMPKNAVVIANMRSGSTFLISCLDSHSEIQAHDGEILLYGSPWRNSGDGDPDVMERYYGQDTDRILAAKMTYVQVNEPVLDFVKARDLRVVHLTRENVICWAFSAATNRHTDDKRYKHIRESDERPEKPSFRVDVQRFLNHAGRCERNQQSFTKKLDKLPNEVLHVTYSDLTGGEGVSAAMIQEHTGRRLCEFLEIPYEPLTSDRRKSGWPMSEVITNWPQLKRVIERSEYADMA